jgi:nucleoside-diphosphate-sugar epimerase
MAPSGTQHLVANHSPPPSVAVVTGASGWLGQNLVRSLAGTRERVRCLVHASDDAPLLEVIGPSVETVIGDVRDPSTVDQLFEGLSPATVFHAAGVIHPLRRTREIFDVNVGGTQLVLDRARRAGAVRFVHVSSNSPFGANPSPRDLFTESSPFHPYMAYGQSKLEAEQLVQRSYDRGDLATVIVRPPWFYGPFQPDRQTRFFSAVRRGRFPLVGDGTNRRSVVFTGNLVQGLLLAETAEAAPGRAYWIADAQPYEMREVVQAVRDALRAEGLPVSLRTPPRLPAAAGIAAERLDGFLQGRGVYVQALHVLGELKDTIACDISRARAELGYEPATSLLDGMRESVRWCLERGAPL